MYILTVVFLVLKHTQCVFFNPPGFHICLCDLPRHQTSGKPQRSDCDCCQSTHGDQTRSFWPRWGTWTHPCWRCGMDGLHFWGCDGRIHSRVTSQPAASEGFLLMEDLPLLCGEVVVIVGQEWKQTPASPRFSFVYFIFKYMSVWWNSLSGAALITLISDQWQ